MTININVLPLTEDLKRFTDHMKAKLSAGDVPEARGKFIELSKNVLARLMVFKNVGLRDIKDPSLLEASS